MKFKKRLLFSAVTALIAFAVFSAIGKPVTGMFLAGGILVGFAIFWMLETRKKPAAPAPEEAAPSGPDPRFAEAVDRMVELNRQVRLDSGFSDEQVTTVEEVIDAGMKVIEAGAAKYPAGHPFVFEICRVVGHWLPDHVSRYGALNSENRASRSKEFLDGIVTLREELAKYAKEIELGGEIQFAANLDMIKIKYGKD